MHGVSVLGAGSALVVLAGILGHYDMSSDHPMRCSLRIWAMDSL
jgi:hypothetical protein